MSAEAAGWFYSHNEERKGPFSKEQLSALLSAGVITEHTKVWSEALAEWTPLFRTELRALLGERPVTPPALDKPVDAPQPMASPAPTAPITYRTYDNRNLAKVLLWGLYLCTGISVFTLFQVFRQKTVEEQFARLKIFEGDQWAVVIAIPLLITMILFLIWKYRATANLFHYAGQHSITPAGAVYWYFVPILWFWKPLQAMSNLWHGSGASRNNSNWFLYGWWGWWLASAVVAIAVALILPENVTTVPEAKAYLFWSAVVVGLDLLSFSTAAEVIKKISEAEKHAMGQA